MKTINELLCLGDGATPAEQSAALSSLLAEKKRLEGLVRLYAARLSAVLQGGSEPPADGTARLPALGEPYWVALSPYKIFAVRYADDEQDIQWHASGVAYPTKQDAREAMGWGVPLPTPLEAVREAFEGIDLGDHPALGFVVLAHDGAQTLRLSRGCLGSIYEASRGLPPQSGVSDPLGGVGAE